MATITEVTGKSYKILADATAGIWHKISMWTKASDVYNNSNKTLETTCGAITGITSSLTSTSTTMAASASAIKQLNDKIADLNSNLANNIVSGYSDTPIGNGKSTATVSIKIPSDNCVIILAHPEDTRATTTLELPTGATLLLSDITSATGVYYRCRYYVVKVTGRAGATLDFNFTSTGNNNYLYIRYVTINSNVSTAITKTNFEKNNLYVIVRNVDHRAIYHDFYGAIYQYYDMTYTTTYFVSYQMANITVLKALEDSERNLKTSGNYSDVIIKLE